MARKVTPIFDSKVVLATVNHGRTVNTYCKNAVIFLQASPAAAVFCIQKGKVTVASEQGKEAVVAILGSGEFFGEGCLIGQPLRLATAKAMADSDVMRVAKDVASSARRGRGGWGQFFHEQVPEAGFHRLQRPPSGSQSGRPVPNVPFPAQ